MIVLFELANGEEYSANAVELEVILQRCQQDQMTGAVQVSSASRGELQFLFSRGELVSIHVQARFDDDTPNGDSWKRMLKESESASVRIILLPSLALRLARLLAESGPPAERRVIKASDLNPVLESWRSPLGLSALHLGWADAEAIMLLPPVGETIRDAIFLSPNGRIDVGQTAVEMAFSRTEGDCVASLFYNQTDSQAWLDSHLHHAFVLLSELMIGRYEQFAGRILVKALSRDVAVTAERENWEISIQGAMVQDAIFQRTAAEVANIYREVLNIVSHHLGVVLGDRRVAAIVAEAMGAIPSPYHEPILAYHLLPESEVSTWPGGH
jgi:hypothetical protein